MDDLLAEFLTETGESLAELDLALVKLEKAPDDAPTLALVFRLVHTIKGTCGFLGLPRLERVTHAGENILVKVRDGEMAATAFVVSVVLRALDRIRAILAGLSAAGSEPAGDDTALIAELNALADGDTASPSPPDQPTQEQPALESSGAATAPGQTIRVDVGVLENLMTMVGELVLTRNQLLQIARTRKAAGDDAEDFSPPLQRLSQITSDLQEGVMKTRMQPIGHAWNKLPRLIRDLAIELDKPIELVMRGAETELDRQVLELIKDPLTHMVRNSADHGLERASARRAADKPDTGTITLDAYHEGGHIVIGVADDGAGLPLGRIRAKALSRQLVTEAELATMDDARIARFIFHPGFSTADQVTSVSGRGVGMDVVKTNVERLGGTIDVFSRPGRGSKFTLKIPLTLAIVAALIVETAGERFALPQIGVMELVRPGIGAVAGQSRVEEIGGAMMLRLRGQLLPLISLADVLRLEPADMEDGDVMLPDPTIVVAKIGATMVGIVVDRVFDTEEIVVKPVASILRNLTVFSGNTILGDGSVIMILDPNGLARAAGLDGRETESRAPMASGAVTSEKRLPMLLVKTGDAHMVVPLSLVARLEHVPRDRVEHTGGQTVTQYRGRLMPLVPISGQLDMAKPEQAVLVFTDTEQATGSDRSMGLVVDAIVDVVEDALHVQLAASRPGVLGTAVVGGQAVEVIDTSFWLTRVFPDWFTAMNTAARPIPRLLIVEDSAFFRQMLVPTLAAEGFDVAAVADAAQALALRDAGRVFDAIVSDIEMPGMSGLDFARRVRATEEWAGTPLIALSGRVAPSDVAAGHEAGFTEYVEKFHREKLVASLRRCLASSPPRGSSSFARALAA